MQGQEPGRPCCELEPGTDHIFFPLSFSVLAVTQLSCPCRSLPVDWAIAARVVLARREGWSAPLGTQLAAAGPRWPEAQPQLCLHQRSSALGLPGRPAGTVLSLVTVTLLSSSADARTSMERVCCEIPPAPQSSTGDNYLHVSLCLARVNDPIASLRLAVLFAPQLLTISFSPKSATVPLISIIKLKFREIISNSHLAWNSGLVF